MKPGTLVAHPDYGKGLVTEFRGSPRSHPRGRDVVSVLWNRPIRKHRALLTEFSCFVTELDIISEVEE